LGARITLDLVEQHRRNMMDVGERLIELLQRSGLTTAFGVPGGQTLPFYRAARAVGFNHVLMRDERSAACAADAYARISGRVGICDATVGPGAADLVPGLAESLASGVAVLAIVADIRTEWEHLRRQSIASQSLEQRELLAPVTKWVARVSHPDAIDEMVDQALRVATTGRPGPVALEIPEDVFYATLTERHRVRHLDDGAGLWPRFRTRPTPDTIEAAAAVLMASQRPLIVAGGGVLSSHAAGALSEFAETHRIGVVTTINGKGSIDETSTASIGVTGAFGVLEAGRAMRDADVLVVIGSKLDQLSTFNWKLPAPSQVVIQIDSDGEQIGRACRVDVSVCGDALEAIGQLDGALNGWQHRWWTTRGERSTEPQFLDGRIVPDAIIREIDDALVADDVVVSDASLASGWLAGSYRVKQPGRGFVAPRGLAGIGWAGGAAIGARMATPPSAKVVAVAGDGAWGYAMAEVETAVRRHLDLVYVVLNNSAFGWITHVEQRVGIVERSLLGDVDFAAAAIALGASGARVSDDDGFRGALHSALRQGGVHVIEVLTAGDASPQLSLGQLGVASTDSVYAS
jgi:acetolactate synthase I/II/III large subunit